MKAKHIIKDKTKKLLWLLLLMISVNGAAQKITLQSVEYNPEAEERWPNDNDCLFKGFVPLFSTESSPMIWSLYLSTDNGDYKVWETSEPTSTWSFKVDDIPFRKIPNKTIYRAENDSARYWTGFVGISDTSNGRLLDCYPITFNLLPPSPRISDFELLYEGYDWECDRLINGKIRFYILADRTSQCIVAPSVPYLPSNGDYYGTPYFLSDDLEVDWTYYKVSFTYSEKEIDEEKGLKVEVSCMDWNQYIIIGALNWYGTSTYKMLFTTDYIKDNNILQRIKDIETSLPSVWSDEILVKWDGNSILLNNDDQLKNIALYDMYGRKIQELVPYPQIDLSAIPSGIYLVACYMKNGKVMTKKIVKK